MLKWFSMNFCKNELDTWKQKIKNDMPCHWTFLWSLIRTYMAMNFCDNFINISKETGHFICWICGNSVTLQITQMFKNTHWNVRKFRWEVANCNVDVCNVFRRHDLFSYANRASSWLMSVSQQKSHFSAKYFGEIECSWKRFQQKCSFIAVKIPKKRINFKEQNSNKTRIQLLLF